MARRSKLHEVVVAHDVVERNPQRLEKLQDAPSLVRLRLFHRLESIRDAQQVAGKNENISSMLDGCRREAAVELVIPVNIRGREDAHRRKTLPTSSPRTSCSGCRARDDGS